LFVMEHHRYPPDVNRGIVPPGMATYLDQTVNWTGVTPIGGRWDWDFNTTEVRAAVSVVEPTASVDQLTEIDRRYDDGNLETGRFRRVGLNRYAEVIEE
jgi:hypothetical protein